MKNKIEKFVYIDLNALDGSKIYLKGPRIIERILNIYKQCEHGMKIFLWTDSADENNKFDPLVYSGEIIYDFNKGDWFIEIDPQKIEHLSRSEEFKGYALEDVLGKEEYQKEKRNHPELF